MARWKLGEAEVEALIAAGELQKLTGQAANGERLLEKASTTLQTARSAIDSDPDSAFVLAYDAARQALTALLARQGLRPTSKGGHYAVERAVKSEFGQGFRQSVLCADAATSWSTPSDPATMPPPRRRAKA